MKIFDWIRIAKISNLFNTSAHVGVVGKCALCKAANRRLSALCCFTLGAFFAAGFTWVMF